MTEAASPFHARLVAREQLAAVQREEMFTLYRRHFDAADLARFCADLDDKQQVIEVRDAAGMLRGFSTLACYRREFEGQPLRVLFSGDTVVDEASWGQQALAFGFIRYAAQTQAQSEEPLYWLLISKGHRTYRYLSAFSIDYAPAPGQVMSPEQQRLMDFLARDRFGSAYDAARGVVSFGVSLGHLRADLAAVPAIHAHLPEVAYFLERNPGYARGEELVCLCRIAADNLRPLARRVFTAAQRELRGADSSTRVVRA
ncbi:MAG: hypothetical protein JNN30_04695 [Rhodanobacteraceae bacterium]|nr:hypothetical protein [Rhodanobacteraceae bacterium]